MIKYSDLVDICRYNLLKNYLNCFKWIVYVRLLFWFIYDILVGFFFINLGLDVGVFLIGKNSIIK